MAKTTSDLVNQTLRNLGVVPQGGKTYTAVERAALTMIESLEQREIVSVTPTTGSYLPDEWYLPLSDILADIVKAEFKREGDQVLPARAAIAEEHLRQMRRGI